jgi:branched-chain amino acid transport system permease protein
MPVINTGRLSQHYLEQGKGETIFFIHGSFATARWWEPVLTLLPTSYRAIAPDLRGCGQSQPANSPEEYAVSEQATDLWALADALALEEFHLVGHSYGAAIALQMTLDRPGPVRSLTLLDPPPAYGVETPAEALEYLDRMRADRDLLARALASTMPAHPANAFFHSLVEDAYRQSPAAFIGPALALAKWQVAHRLTSLRLPVLLVWGELDIIVDRASVTEMLLSIPGANYLEVLRGVGHSAHVEAPATFTQILLRFITEDLNTTTPTQTK